MLRLKRCFPKIDAGEFGTVRLLASDETARDLEWFLLRYQIPVDPAAASELAARAAAARQREERASAAAGGFIPVEAAMVLPLRPYQEVAVAVCRETGGLLLADELGLGKTVTAIGLLASAGALPAAVVVQAHLPGQWKEMLARFAPAIRTRIAPSCEPEDLGADVVILSYAKLASWAEFLRGCRSVIYDEVQELRHHGSQRYRAAAYLSELATFRMGLSATPIYNYGEEWFNVIEACSPGKLGTRQEFMREWCTVGFRDRQARVKDPVALGSFLRESGIMLRRLRSEVQRELPPLTRILQGIPCDRQRLDEMRGTATDLARLILDKTVDQLRRGQAGQQFSLQLRQATGIGKAPYVADFVRLLLEETGEPVVLFGWHREVYEIWTQCLAEYRPAWYTGSESPAKKAREAERFLSGDSRVLFMSLRSGSGLDGLQKVCRRVVFGELDWSPGAMDQCIGRVYRDEQREGVLAYYLLAEDGIDPFMERTLGLKRGQRSGVTDPAGDFVDRAGTDTVHVAEMAAAYLARHSSGSPNDE